MRLEVPLGTLDRLYRPSLALFTDLYELTMAYGYWKAGVHERHASFHLHFRSAPFGGGYAVACGIETAAEFLERFRFSSADLDFLQTLTGNDGKRLFEEAFLDALAGTPFQCDVDAVPDGTVIFGAEPLLRVTGPILQAQIVESALLNLVNFQTLIATKASRIRTAVGDDPVIEFGLRRAQGIDGSISAARAAYVGGCDGTSNVLAGRLLNIPVRGTHAHSWVMFFENEREAFLRYAEAMPNNCIFLVDTYDSGEGVRNAAEVGRWLRDQGHEMVGIRLDSGDLAYLSIEARRILDLEGFENASIFASNDLDERIVTSLKLQGAKIDSWGIGTKLVTGFPQPSLGGVYKLTAVQNADGTWGDRIKLSEQSEKVSFPGLIRVRRFALRGEYIGDQIYDERIGPDDPPELVDPLDSTRRKKIDPNAEVEELLEPLFRAGRRVANPQPLAHIRERAAEQLRRFHAGIKRFENPHRYPVGLEPRLHDRRRQLILENRLRADASPPKNRD